MKPESSLRQRPFGTASTWVFAGFALVALFFLLTEHRAHLYGWLPFILLAACPLMHLFHGHGGHGGHGHQAAGDEPRQPEGAPPSGAASAQGSPVPPVAHHRH